MNDTNTRINSHRAALAKKRRSKWHKTAGLSHSLDHFRNTDQAELKDAEGGQ